MAPEADSQANDRILLGENLELLPALGDESFQLIYIDPPFNTGAERSHTALRVVRDEEGGRTGFQGRRYSAEERSRFSYSDSFEDYLDFLEPRLAHAHRLLGPEGTLYFHIDYREAHYCKLLLDEIFGRDCFLNEIIWAYDYGARSKRRWPAKHDTILVYVKDADGYYFDSEGVDREPYMAPGLVTAEKVAKGKVPTDVWWHTVAGRNRGLGQCSCSAMSLASPPARCEPMRARSYRQERCDRVDADGDSDDLAFRVEVEDRNAPRRPAAAAELPRIFGSRHITCLATQRRIGRLDLGGGRPVTDVLRGRVARVVGYPADGLRGWRGPLEEEAQAPFRPDLDPHSGMSHHQPVTEDSLNACTGHPDRHVAYRLAERDLGVRRCCLRHPACGERDSHDRHPTPHKPSRWHTRRLAAAPKPGTTGSTPAPSWQAPAATTFGPRRSSCARETGNDKIQACCRTVGLRPPLHCGSAP